MNPTTMNPTTMNPTTMKPTTRSVGRGTQLTSPQLMSGYKAPN